MVSLNPPRALNASGSHTRAGHLVSLSRGLCLGTSHGSSLSRGPEWVPPYVQSKERTGYFYLFSSASPGAITSRVSLMGLLAVERGQRWPAL